MEKLRQGWVGRVAAGAGLLGSGAVALAAAIFLLTAAPHNEAASFQSEVLSSPAPVVPPSPARVAEVSFWSQSLGRVMPMFVYLPPAYLNNDKPLPVLYMLHGLNGSHNDWQRMGLFDTATQLIASGQIPPMIIVAPAGENGYWLDHFNGGPRFGSYVSKDLVAYVDKHYRTAPERAFRAIGGMSMGAHGALQLALNNPNTFSIVGAHSVALRTKQQAFPLFGDETYFRQHDPVSILAKDPGRANGLRLWIDIGRNDSWFKAANAFHSQLQSLNVAHSWQVWDGGHDAAYCSSHIADYLRYYGQAFASVEMTPTPTYFW